MNRLLQSYLLAIAITLLSCSKGGDTPPDPGGSGGGTGGGGTQTSNCVLSAISQVNSGKGAESSLQVLYNNNGGVSNLVVYDSVTNKNNFEAAFTYITNDSVRLGPQQYLLLDGSKRVTRLVTQSDPSRPLQADTYVFDYEYNSEGFLVTKNLYINGAKKANYRTVYSYSNQQLISCRMTIPSAAGQTVLESALTYDDKTTIKNWMYTFPDAMEGYPYLTILNFGKKVIHPLTKVITKIYNPANGSLLDTWTTEYKNYTIDANGYVLSGTASGDLQQGIAAFYGKTNFYYYCN